MPTTTTLNAVFDGVNDVDRLDGATSSFDSGHMGYYSVHNNKADDNLIANVTLENDFRVATMRFGADFSNTTFIEDLDAGERRIDFLQLGYNSDVDLISTRVRFIYGWDGDKHVVKLGDQQNGHTSMIELYAKENIVTTGNAWVNSVVTGGSDGDTVKIGSGGAGSVRTGSGNDKVTTTSEYVGIIRTRDGDDKVTTGSAWVDLINTGNGNDVVKVGSGSAEIVVLGDGNDKIYVTEIKPDYGIDIKGNNGTDTLYFSGFSLGVTFSIDYTGYQNVTNPTNDSGGNSKGWFRQSQLENVVGTNKGDHLTGDWKDNELTGKRGSDTLNGGDGNDKLKGDAGNDKLNGEKGNDSLIGGGGKDKLNGGEGNDTLRGKAGADVFIFGENSGTDTVKDYVKSSDLLRLEGHTGGFADLTISYNRQQDATIVDHDNGTIVLDGFSGNLTSSQFDFV